MEQWVNKVAVVTGGSGGIGAEICTKLSEEGLKVVSLSRRINPSQTGSANLYPLECDVTDLQQVEQTFGWIHKNVGPVQILINNAGVMKFGSFVDGDPKDWQEVFDVNVMGVLNCTRQVLGRLKETGLDGQIIHMNSINGHYCVVGKDPLFCNVKSASKKAITCINDCMRKEMWSHKLHIKVTSLSPGFVDTGTEICKGICKDHPKLKTEDVANAVVYILSTPPNTHIQELIIRPFGEFIC